MRRWLDQPATENSKTTNGDISAAELQRELVNKRPTVQQEQTYRKRWRTQHGETAVDPGPCGERGHGPARAAGRRQGHGTARHRSLRAQQRALTQTRRKALSPARPACCPGRAAAAALRRCVRRVGEAFSGATRPQTPSGEAPPPGGLTPSGCRKDCRPRISRHVTEVGRKRLPPAPHVRPRRRAPIFSEGRRALRMRAGGAQLVFTGNRVLQNFQPVFKLRKGRIKAATLRN
ncbi:uncharacterized protein LOC116230813 [Phasianus colchicus]|uniref:uncharacterized protein LOC116230813 n=1 Tax=Phasianus colchicus TaxID=9054 RepID=UPI00129EFB0B|nr:uncharacterized protein LOC116230813 [Phasianus colchicus]